MYIETDWNSSPPQNMKEAVKLLETVIVDLGGRFDCGKQERNLKARQKIIWQFGTLDDPTEALAVLQGTLDFVFQVLSNTGLEQRRDIQPTLRRLQECVTKLRSQVESEGSVDRVAASRK